MVGVNDEDPFPVPVCLSVCLSVCCVLSVGGTWTRAPTEHCQELGLHKNDRQAELLEDKKFGCVDPKEIQDGPAVHRLR